MTRQHWPLALIAAAVLAGSGCVSCGNKGYALAHDAGPDCELPESQRNRVYVFAVGGLNPAGMMALDSLRLKLNELGYAKVASGQTLHTLWMAGEMRRIHAEEPDAVFVVIGTESGTDSAARLAEKAIAEGLPVTALVLLDAEGKTPAPNLGVRTLTVGNGYGNATTTGFESVVVPDVGRYGLLTDPRTVQAVGRVLNEIAASVPISNITVPAEWSYPHAPHMRPEVRHPTNTEWSYLFDQPGGTTRAIGEAVPVIAANPTPDSVSTRRP